MFTRVAIVNRGEAAMRLIHAVRDLNAQGGGAPIHTIALYTDEERTAMFAREADEAYSLGPASARPYIDLAVLERVLVECAADAVWVGWGFVAEDPAFADLCERLGVTFIGPSADAMRRLGDKIGSKLLAEEVGVPVAPWSGGGVDTLEAALAAADTHRLPAHAQGHRRRRWPRHPQGRLGRRARGRLPAHPRRGRARLRQRRGLPRAPGDRGTARRGPADRRRPRHGVGGRRPRLHRAAAQPEGDRGVGVAAARRRARPTSSRRPPSGWRSPSGTSAPGPSSSSTTRASGRSPSSRSTPGCRSSTRSPR